MKKITNEKTDKLTASSLLDKGLKTIIHAFNEQKIEYTQKISLLQTEIKKLKEENFIYKKKLTLLQEKLNSLSKTVLLLDEEAEEAKNEITNKYNQTLNLKDIEFNINQINKKKNHSINRNNNNLNSFKHFNSTDILNNESNNIKKITKKYDENKIKINSNVNNNTTVKNIYKKRTN